MKKLILFISSFAFIVILFLAFKNNLVLAATKVSNARCLTISGTFNAKNWSGGTMMVGCNGDNGKFCKGQIAEVKPGKSYNLTKCSCPPYASGCLVIGKKLVLKNDGPNKRPRLHVVGNRVPNKCELIHKKNVCGTNGHAINVDFKVTCQKEECPVPNPVLNVKVNCPNCSTQVETIPAIAPAAEGESCGRGASDQGNVQCRSGLTCVFGDDPSLGTCELVETGAAQ